jgi:hypothetical protein
MRTFVVRVYGSGQGIGPDHDHLMGIVEEISTGAQARFHTSEELVAILDCPQLETPRLSRRGETPPREPQTPSAGLGKGSKRKPSHQQQDSTGEVF